MFRKSGLKNPLSYRRDIREIDGSMAVLELFIGADSRRMHLSNPTKKPTLGLFTVTDVDKYGPYGSHSPEYQRNGFGSNSLGN